MSTINQINPVTNGETGFNEQVMQATEKFVLVDFWAEWCTPCRMVHPTLEAFSKELAGQVKIVQVDMDIPENQEFSVRNFNVMSIPTLLIYDTDAEGKKVLLKREVGARPRPAFEDLLKSVGVDFSTAAAA